LKTGSSFTKKILTIILAIIILPTLLLPTAFAQEPLRDFVQGKYENNVYYNEYEPEITRAGGEFSEGDLGYLCYAWEKSDHCDKKQYKDCPEVELPKDELPDEELTEPELPFCKIPGIDISETMLPWVKPHSGINVSNFFQLMSALLSASNSPGQVVIRVTEDIILPYRLNISADSNVRLEADRNVRLRTLSAFRHFAVRGTLVITDNITLSSVNIGYGGGVLVQPEGTLEMRGGEISGNAWLSGGGVAVDDGTFIMMGGIIADNRADGAKLTSGSTVGYGGGVFVDGGVFHMSGGVIDGNTTLMHGRGGGVAVVGDGVFNMSGNAAITNNRTFSPIGIAPSNSGQGGGVRVNSGATFIMSGNTMIADNRCEGGNAGNGGGVSVGGVFDMHGGTITRNRSNNNDSNAVHFSDDGVFNLRGGLIEDNGNQHSAANALFVYEGSFNMYGGTIRDQNGAGVVVVGVVNISGGSITDNRRAGVSVSGGDGIELHISGDARIHNNTNIGDGGGVRMTGGGNNSIITMTGGYIENNTADGNGGGVWLGQSSTTFNMSGGSIGNNTADGNGGGVWLGQSSTTLNMSGGYIENNTAYSGGGIYAVNISSLTTSPDASFRGNRALSGGRFGPDDRWTAFPNLSWYGSNSLGGTLDPESILHLINNFDINTNQGELYTGSDCDCVNCVDYGDCECCDNGSGPGDGSGAGPGDGSGTGPGTGPGDGSGAGPGDGSGTGPGDGSGTGPGDGSGTGPGDGSGAGPGDGSGAGPGDGSGTGPGDGSGTGPGDGSGTGPGDGSGTGPGDGSGTGPGDGSGTGPGSGSGGNSADDDSNNGWHNDGSNNNDGDDGGTAGDEDLGENVSGEETVPDNGQENNQIANQGSPAADEIVRGDQDVDSDEAWQISPYSPELQTIVGEQIPLVEGPQSLISNRNNNVLIAAETLTTDLLHEQAQIDIVNINGYLGYAVKSAAIGAIEAQQREFRQLGDDSIMQGKRTFQRIEVLIPEYIRMFSQFPIYFDDITTINFMGRLAPLHAPSGTSMDTWALMNLVVSLAGAALVMLCTFKTLRCGYKGDKTEQTKTSSGHKFGWLATAVAVGIGGMILFILTQDVRATMVLVDGYTAIHTLLLSAVFIATVLLARRKKARL